MVPPQDNRANSDNPAAPPQGNRGHSTTTGNSSATLDHDNRAPSQRNGGQPDSNVDLTTQLTNFFCQFMPVTGQSETTNPRPEAANNDHSTSTQVTATNDGIATNTGQIPTSISQSMLANQALSSGNQPLAATDGSTSRASSI